MSRNQQMVDVNLNAPKTPDELKSNVVGHVRLAEGECFVPYMDGEDITSAPVIRKQQTVPSDGKPHLRFYAVGPSSCQISCPLCKNRADTETVQMSGILGSLSCLLSTLSCCFPIFSLSFVYMCLQSRYKSKRLFCNKCGGYLGYYWRPS